jgi:hypothetical protein
MLVGWIAQIHGSVKPVQNCTQRPVEVVVTYQDKTAAVLPTEIVNLAYL